MAVERHPLLLTWRTRRALALLRSARPSIRGWNAPGILGGWCDKVPEQCSAGMFLFAVASLFPRSLVSPSIGLRPSRGTHHFFLASAQSPRLELCAEQVTPT